MSESYPQLEVVSRQQWRQWLATHHADTAGVWVVTNKKGSGRPHVTYDEIAEEAIAHGWVDSQPRKLDADRSQLLVTPRSPRSNWSRVNKQRVERLLPRRTHAPGGGGDGGPGPPYGHWTALDEVENLVEPEDLTAAVDADPAARRHWNGFPRSVRRGILEWINAAKRPETRSRRVEETARLAADNIRANYSRQPKGR